MSGPTVIKDGLTGKTARVNNKNQIEAFAVSVAQVVNSSVNGDAFFITTGIVNLSTDGESWILNIKNNESIDWVINSLTVDFGASDGVGDIQAAFSSGATGGTLIDSGVTIPASNLNLGSAKELDSDIKLGAEGSTVSGGPGSADVLIPETSKTVPFISSPIIVGPGTSLAVGITPAAGNSSMDVQARVIVYRQVAS